MPQYELNLRDYWQIIQKRWMVLLIIFFVVLISTVIYTNIQKPVYQAVASVQWAEHRTLGSILTELVTVSIGNPLVTQSKIITSLPILERVALELGLTGKDASPTEITEQASAIQGMVSTQIAQDTSIIHISVTHRDPQLAADIANKIAEVYIDESLREKSKESRNVRAFIERQLEEVSSKLKASEDLLAKFSETEGPSGAGLPLQRRLADLETERQNLLQHLQRRLADLETERQNLLQHYTALHPDVKNIDEQIAQLKERLKGLPWEELEYNRLSREVAVNAALYRQLKDKLAAARIAEAEKIGEASLIDKAAPPDTPVGPNKRLNYFLGIFIGITLGLTGTFVVEQLDTSIGTIEDVESYLKLPALGVIPYLRTKDEKGGGFIQRLLAHKEFKGEEKILRLRNQLLINYSSASAAFEAYRILRTNIQTEVFKEKIQGKILLLSSAGPEEGKSITITNLAIVMAQGGLHTLLIDADMRRSAIHRIFGLKQREPGLCDILRGTTEPKAAIRTVTDVLMGELGFDEILKTPGMDNLNILTGGSLSTTPAELLSSTEMASLLEKLRDKFDLILIDSPPVLAVADAAILAPKTDGIILVYRVGKTARSVLVRAKTQLEKSGASVKGIILNNISPEIEMRYGYYYQYKYYGKYYAEKKKET